jgi:hypothetical protein
MIGRAPLAPTCKARKNFVVAAHLQVRRNDEVEAQSRSGAGQMDFLRDHQS